MARILVIDDHEDLCAFLQELLQSEGYTVNVAADGNSGLELQRRVLADVVISDIFMPDKDGVETIHQLKEEFPQVKIIAMSGGGTVSKQVDYLAMAREFGADSLLSKPFEAHELLTAVRAMLKQ
jgi:DNA-binding response OmpR family regulator